MYPTLTMVYNIIDTQILTSFPIIQPNVFPDCYYAKYS